MDIKELADKLNLDDIIKQAADETFAELKVSAVALFKEHVLPGLKAAKESFIEKLKTEITASDTAVGVKIKDAFLLGVVVIVGTFGGKVLNLLSKAEEAEAAALDTNKTAQ